MPPITTEADWLACDDPREMAKFARERIDPQQFLQLAVTWAGRIRHLFDENETAWYDAFAAWAAGVGPHPKDVCVQPEWGYSFCSLLERDQSVAFCVHWLHVAQPIGIAVHAGLAVALDIPRFDPVADPSRTHRKRSKRGKAVVEIARLNWEAAKEAHAARVRRDFCDDFRAAAGNPFIATTDPRAGPGNS